MAVPTLKSVVVNTSGTRTYFDFLVPGGLYLNAGEEFEYWGNIFDWILKSGSNGNRNKKMKALQHCLDAGLCEIKTYTETVMFDETLQESRKITVDNGAIVLVDPSV
jgi:hypothetical protein